MSKTINLKIDAKEIKVPEGIAIIDAAETAGIHIPNLCHLKGMRGIGACRMCLVEVEGNRGPVTACTAKVKEGMVINTDTEKLQEMRKFVLDLILSMHPLDCMTCTKAGVCTLQQYAYDAGIKESTFTRKEFGYPVDEANPFIKRDSDYCILCGRCVRVCKEQGTNVLDFMGRGVGSKVATAKDAPLQESDCTFCGSCVDVCPVNALLEADRWRKGREWEYTKTESVCLSCGNGCDITVSTKDGGIVKINSGGDAGSVEKYICATGRFGFDALTSDLRITTPMKKVGNELKETTWEDALGIAAEKLKAAGDSAGIISSAGILNEDAALLSKLASDVIKTKNIDSSASLYADADSVTSEEIDLDSADVVMLVGVSSSQKERVLPALDAALKKKAQRGAKLIVINSADIDMASSAAISIKDDEASALAQIAKALTATGAKADKDMEAALSGVNADEDAEKAAELISKAGAAVIITSPSFLKATRNISLLSNAKAAAVTLEANASGVIAAGVTTTGRSYSEMASGGIDALLAVGELPISKRPDVKFLIVQTSYMSDLAKEADVVLPAATALESEGAIISYLGKTKNAAKAVEPAGDSKQHKAIVIELSKAMGSSLETASTSVKTAESKASFSPFEKKAGLDVDAVWLNDAVNAAVINSSRLLWLKETEKAVV